MLSAFATIRPCHARVLPNTSQASSGEPIGFVTSRRSGYRRDAIARQRHGTRYAAPKSIASEVVKVEKRCRARIPASWSSALAAAQQSSSTVQT